MNDKIINLVDYLLSLQSVIIADGSEQYKRFVKLPQPLNFKVYIFNVTNPDRIQQGAIPIVEEIGPYVYRWVQSNRFKEYSIYIIWYFQAVPSEEGKTFFEGWIENLLCAKCALWFRCRCLGSVYPRWSYSGAQYAHECRYKYKTITNINLNIKIPPRNYNFYNKFTGILTSIRKRNHRYLSGICQ